MSVGGRLIEIAPHVLRDPDDPSFRKDVIRLWVVGQAGTETVVYCEPDLILPVIGDEIWWQGRTIYFDGDRKKLTKVGYSTSAPS